MSTHSIKADQTTKHEQIPECYAQNQRIFLHCDNGKRVPLLTDESVHSIVENYLGKPFTFFGSERDESHSVVRCAEFVSPIPFRWNNHSAHLTSVYTLSDKYMQTYQLHERIRMRFVVYFPTGVHMKMSAAYVPGMFSDPQNEPQKEIPPSLNPGDPVRVSRQMVLDYATETSHESAANLLLILGPDWYAGDYQDYNELMYILTNSKP